MSPAATAPRVVPRFTADQRRELQAEAGLSPAQLLFLERALPNIAFDLQPSAPRNDVAHPLDTLARHLKAAALVIKRLDRSRRPDPDAEALGHLNMAAAALGWCAPHDGQVPDGYPIPSELIPHLALIAEQAHRAVPQCRRTPSVASWRAVEFIVEALNRPQDSASRAAAAKLPVTRAEKRPGAPSFLHVAEVVFQAATGRADANPDRSIRAYLARQARRAGGS